MRDFLIRIIELPLSLVEDSRRITSLVGVIFLSTYYFWGIVLINLFSGHAPLLGSIPLSLIPPFTTILGIFSCLVFGSLTRRKNGGALLKSIILAGMLLDFFGYEVSGAKVSMLAFLYVQIGISLICLTLLHFELGKIVIILGLASLVVPWVGIPLCNQVSVCGTVEPAQTQTLTPVLEVQGYHGYNITLYNSMYYGIPQTAGAFSISKIQSGGYSSYYVGSSIPQVEHEINSGTS